MDRKICLRISMVVVHLVLLVGLGLSSGTSCIGNDVDKPYPYGPENVQSFCVDKLDYDSYEKECLRIVQIKEFTAADLKFCDNEFYEDTPVNKCLSLVGPEMDLALAQWCADNISEDRYQLNCLETVRGHLSGEFQAEALQFCANTINSSNNYQYDRLTCVSEIIGKRYALPDLERCTKSFDSDREQMSCLTLLGFEPIVANAE